MASLLRSDLIGTWEMVSWVQRRGEEQILPMGESPVGVLVYTDDGMMSVNIMRRDRPLMQTGDFVTGSTAEKAEAFGSYLGYCGTFELEGSDVAHQITCASYPNWVGQRQMRSPRMVDGLLVLEAAPRIVNSVSVTATLTWRRRRHG